MATVGNLLIAATDQLTTANIITARLDATVLIADLLDQDRAAVLAHPEQELTIEQTNQLQTMLERRAQHEPLAYIREKAEFFGRTFYVNHRVLVPRPETETMIETLRALKLPPATRIADIGTGSGCIGITAALEVPRSHVDVYDIDPDALAIAKHNARLHHSKLQFHQGNLLEKAWNNYDVILANLPYVPDSYPINEAAGFEPKIALFGGPDGLRDYRTLFQQIAALPHQPTWILTESLPSQHHGLATLARHYGYTLQETNDFIQLFHA